MGLQPVLVGLAFVAHGLLGHITLIEASHRFAGKTYKLWVVGWQHGSLGKFVGSNDDGWLSADWTHFQPFHFVKVPGRSETYMLRYDHRHIQTYVCMRDDTHVRSDCDRRTALQVDMRPVANGMYKMLDSKKGKYLTYDNNWWQPRMWVQGNSGASGAMLTRLYQGVNLLAPHKVDICYQTIFHVAGNSTGYVKEKLKWTNSMNQTKSYEKEIMLDTSTTIGVSFPFKMFQVSAENTVHLQSMARTATQLTQWSTDEKELEVMVDYSKPCYIYGTKITTTYKNGGQVTQGTSEPRIQFSSPVSPNCVSDFF